MSLFMRFAGCIHHYEFCINLTVRPIHTAADETAGVCSHIQALGVGIAFLIHTGVCRLAGKLPDRGAAFLARWVGDCLDIGKARKTGSGF